MTLFPSAWLTVSPVLAQRINLLPQQQFPPMPKAYLEELVEQIGLEVTELRARQSQESDPYRVLAIEAQIKLRSEARLLLEAAYSDPRTSMAAHYGIKLTQQFEALDELFGQLPKQVQRVKEVPSAYQTDRLNQMIRAMNRFIGLATKTANQDPFDATDPDSIEFYVYMRISSLTELLEPVGQHLLGSTWLQAQPQTTDSQDHYFSSPVNTEGLGQLRQRVEAIESMPQSRDQLLGILNVLSSACRFPDLLGRVDQSYRLMTRLADTLHAVERSTWLDHNASSRLDKVVSGFLTVYRDPQLRPVAVEKINRLIDDQGLFASLTRLADSTVDVTPFHEVFATAVNFNLDNPDSAIGPAMLQWLTSAATAVEDHHSVTVAAMSPDIRRAYIRLGEECTRLEMILLSHARELAHQPRQVYHPITATLIDTMTRLVDELQKIAGLSLWLEQVGEFSDRPTYEIYRRFNQGVGTTGPANQVAMDELVNFARQSARFGELPGERRLREDLENNAKQPLGLPRDTAEGLLETIDRQRADWITSWAGNTPTSETGRVMGMLERLMRWIDRTMSVTNGLDAAQSMNKWAAWQVQPQAMARWILSARHHLIDAADAAAHGRMGDVQQMLDEIESKGCVSLLFATLYDQQQHRLADLPSDPSVLALSQLLYAPDQEAYMAKAWPMLVTISRYLNELSMPDMVNDNTAHKKLAPICHDLIALSQSSPGWTAKPSYPAEPDDIDPPTEP